MSIVSAVFNLQSPPPAAAAPSPVGDGAAFEAALTRAMTPAGGDAGAAPDGPAPAGSAGARETNSAGGHAVAGSTVAREAASAGGSGQAAPAAKPTGAATPESAGSPAGGRAAADAPGGDQGWNGSVGSRDDQAEGESAADGQELDPSGATVQLASQALAAFMAAFVAMVDQAATVTTPAGDQGAGAVDAAGGVAGPADLTALAAAFGHGDAAAAPDLGAAGAALAQLIGPGSTSRADALDLGDLLGQAGAADRVAVGAAETPPTDRVAVGAAETPPTDRVAVGAAETPPTDRVAVGAAETPPTDQLIALLSAAAADGGATASRQTAQPVGAAVASLGAAAPSEPKPAADLAAAAAELARALTHAAGAVAPGQAATAASPRTDLGAVVDAARSLTAVAEIGQQLKLGSVSGHSQVTVRLDPESLGTVELEVQRGEGGVSVRVTAGTAAARQAVEFNLAAIEAALREAGVAVDDLRVSGPTVAPAAPPLAATAAARAVPAAAIEPAAGERETADAASAAADASAPVAERSADETVGSPSATQSTAASAPTGATVEAPTADRTQLRADNIRLVKDIAQQIGLLGGQGKSDFQLQLNPDSLGRLHVRLTMEDGAMTVRMTAQSSEARSAIESNLGQLRQSFQEQGIRVDRFVVVAAPAQFGQDNQHPRRSRGWVDPQPSGRRAEDEGDFARTLAAVGAPRSLDYRA